MADHDGNHRCLVEKNVPIVFILPSRWQDGADSLGIETTSCLWFSEAYLDGQDGGRVANPVLVVERVGQLVREPGGQPRQDVGMPVAAYRVEQVVSGVISQVAK